MLTHNSVVLCYFISHQQLLAILYQKPINVSIMTVWAALSAIWLKIRKHKKYYISSYYWARTLLIFAFCYREYSATLIRILKPWNVNSILRKKLFILIFIKKYLKKEYHQKIFCQFLRFFNNWCSYFFQKCIAKIKVLPKISFELH